MEENAKLNSVPKGKERRQLYNQDGIPKRSAKSGLIKNDLSQLVPPQSHENDSPIKKMLSEANKIVKIGMEKDFALLEKDTTLQNSNEMVDNLRKNILHLQMEYEKLDQNYQREISYRSEIVKRVDATRETVESVIQSSNALSKSLKLLEEDKFKIAEFYEVIYQNQNEVETKYLKVEKLLQENDDLLKSKMETIKKSHDKTVFQHAEAVSQLNKKLNYASDKLKVVVNENEKLQKQIQEIQESSHKLEVCLEQQQRLNCLHEENTVKFKSSLRKLKIQRFRYQRLWKRKKMQIFEFLKRYKALKKKLKKTELLYSQYYSANKTLELNSYEWERKFEKHLEDDQARIENLETEKNQLNETVLCMKEEIKSLQTENKNLNEKIVEVFNNEKSKQVEVEQIQNELAKMLSENLKLKDEILKITDESNDRSKVISDLQKKVNTSDADFLSQIEFHKKETQKYQALVNQLENQLLEMQERLALEKKQMERTISDFDYKFDENLKASNQKINDLEKLLQEKTVFIRKLETEKGQATLDNQKSVGKLGNELQTEKCKNEELTQNLENMRKSYEDVNQQLEKAKKQISDITEKLTDVNALNKALNRTQNDLETNVANLKKEIEFRKKSFEDLEEKHKKVKKDLAKMQKTTEENASLKSSVDDLKNLLEATEARVEAYKVVVKKLESEKVEAKNTHSEEVSRFKMELARLEEATKMGKDPSKRQIETPKKKFEQANESMAETSQALPSGRPNMKENEPELVDIEKWQQISTPPPQSGKKFLSTPRKIYTSTPQSGFRTLTPAQKKRDPYELDSDSSVERFDQDKVLKLLDRQKRETYKRSKKK